MRDSRSICWERRLLMRLPKTRSRQSSFRWRFFSWELPRMCCVQKLDGFACRLSLSAYGCSNLRDTLSCGALVHQQANGLSWTEFWTLQRAFTAHNDSGGRDSATPLRCRGIAKSPRLHQLRNLGEERYPLLNGCGELEKRATRGAAVVLTSSR